MAGTAYTNGATGGRERAPEGGASVKGVFHDRELVKSAVRHLTENSIPADSIRVFVVDPTGRGRREITVQDEAGALEGALIGAAIGSGVAVIAVGVMAAGLFGPSSASLGLLSGLSAIALGIAVGVPLGGLFGMGHWQGWRDIPEKGVRPGHVEVVVESDELAPLARGVLEDAGADRVEIA